MDSNILYGFLPPFRTSTNRQMKVLITVLCLFFSRHILWSNLCDFPPLRRNGKCWKNLKILFIVLFSKIELTTFIARAAPPQFVHANIATTSSNEQTHWCLQPKHWYSIKKRLINVWRMSFIFVSNSVLATVANFINCTRTEYRCVKSIFSSTVYINYYITQNVFLFCEQRFMFNKYQYCLVGISLAIKYFGKLHKQRSTIKFYFEYSRKSIVPNKKCYK